MQRKQSSWQRWVSRLAGLGMMAAVLSACTTTLASPPARVFFLEPQNEAVVDSPVQVRLGAENFTIEPAGEVRQGAGHLHIMVDTPCLAAGEVIPKDERHLHYGDGQREATLELAPGQHTLCLQAADGAHRALAGTGMTQMITVDVR
jgi:hypothetical protein